MSEAHDDQELPALDPRACDALTPDQLTELADGVIPHPTDEQLDELFDFVDQLGVRMGLTMAWIAMGRLLHDHHRGTVDRSAEPAG